MRRAAGIPIRFKILLGVLLVVTAAVSTITFTMAQLFQADKKVYVRDLSSVQAIHAAEETRAVLALYRDRLEMCAQLLDNPRLASSQRTALAQDVLQGLHGFVSLTCYARGVPIAAVVDRSALEEAGITEAQLKRYRDAHPLPFVSIVSGRTFVDNSTVGTRMPTLTIAVAHRRKPEATPLILSAVMRLDELMGVATRSQSFTIFVTDADGLVLSSRDRSLVTGHARLAGIPRLGAHSAARVREFADRGVDKIAGYAAIEGTELIAVAEIPKAAAYFASRALLNSLLLVALVLLAAAAVVSMIWSQALTRSIEDLLHAAQAVGEGRFDVEVRVRSRDEIGTLAQAFNQMAREVNARERALKDAKGRLIQSEKMAAFGQLGAGVAHEVKNPLAGILGVVQLLRRKRYEDPTLNENLETVEKEARRCRSIIDNLLRFARQEHVSLAPVRVAPIVTDAVAIMRHQMALNRVTLDSTVPETLPLVQGNANQLQQVLMNLIMNAQQAMAGKPGEIVIEASESNDTIVLCVRDNGPGIPKDIQRRVFEPFFTTKPSGQGTGLGLSVSYGIVQEHRGSIVVESEPGQGTTFVITLPVATSGPAAADPVPPIREAA